MFREERNLSPTFETLLFLGTSGWRIWEGQMEEDQSEVELQVRIRRNADESSSLTGWRAPGSHQTHPHLGTHPATNRGTGSPLPPPPRGRFPAKPTSHPKTKQNLRGKYRRPLAPRRLPPPPSAALSLRPSSRSPEAGEAGAGEHRDGNVKSLAIPRSSCCARCPPSPTSSAATARARDAHD